MGSRGYRFGPASGNTTTAAVPSRNLRYLRLTVSANTAWLAGQH